MSFSNAHDSCCIATQQTSNNVQNTQVRHQRTTTCVQELAVASQDEVNDMWAGLGYYRRARYLLEGAQYVQNKLGGQIPVTAAELQKIPGLSLRPSKYFAFHCTVCYRWYSFVVKTGRVYGDWAVWMCMLAQQCLFARLLSAAAQFVDACSP